MNVEKIANELNLTPWETAALQDAANGENEYVDNPVFHDADEKKRVMDFVLPTVPTWQLQGNKRNATSVVLTREQEEIAFLKYNYTRFLIDYYVKQFKDNGSPVIVNVILKNIRASIEYRNYIIEMNLKLIVSMIKHRIGHRGEMDDLFSDGQMIMLEAVKKFDVSQGTKFSTYAFWSILRAWNRTNKKESERLERFGLSLEGREGEDIDIAAKPRLADDNESFCIEAITRILDENMAHLSGDEIKVLKFRYFSEGKKPTMGETSKSIGIKKHKVTLLEKRALDKIHRVLEREFLS